MTELLAHRIDSMTPEQMALGNAHPNNRPGWSIFGPTLSGRTCGHCVFCCIVIPVEEPLNKPGGVRCVHLKHKGCGIYKQRPDVCAAWKCAWLYQPEAKILKRPDIGGYAIDCSLQQILMNDQPVSVIQVWVDPDRRDAHKAPELRAYLGEMARTLHLPAIIRWPDGKAQEGETATVLFAPILTGEDWVEVSSGMIPHAEMAKKLERART